MANKKQTKDEESLKTKIIRKLILALLIAAATAGGLKIYAREKELENKINWFDECTICGETRSDYFVHTELKNGKDVNFCKDCAEKYYFENTAVEATEELKKVFK